MLSDSVESIPSRSPPAIDPLIVIDGSVAPAVGVKVIVPSFPPVKEFTPLLSYQTILTPLAVSFLLEPPSAVTEKTNLPGLSLSP